MAAADFKDVLVAISEKNGLRIGKAPAPSTSRPPAARSACPDGRRDDMGKPLDWHRPLPCAAPGSATDNPGSRPGVAEQ
jgi:hypothetical protein